MADIQDLFIERIDGDRYLFEDEWLPLELVRRRSPSRAARAGAARHSPHPPRADRQRGARRRRGRAARPALDRRSTSRPRSSVSSDSTTSPPGPELVAMLEEHTSPVSNLIWADRHGSIGYKLVGRLPIRRGGCPDLPKPGWTGEFEWEGTVPYDEMPEVIDPESGLPGDRQQPGRRRRLSPPHHQRLARRLPGAADRGAAERGRANTTSRTSRRCSPTTSRSPGWRSPAASGG